jgi:hypothetical protein
LCLVQEAVDEFLRVFQMPGGLVEALSASNGVLQLRVLRGAADDAEEDRIRQRLRQHLELKFPCVRSVVIQFGPSGPPGGAT